MADRDYDHFDGEYELDALEEAMGECSQTDDGYCGQAGSEYCDFDCPFRRDGDAKIARRNNRRERTRR